MTSITSRTYRFTETNPTLIKILDELVRDRQLTPTIHNLLVNGLGTDIKKTRKNLKQRMDGLAKVERLYKKLQIQDTDKIDAKYRTYKKYRDNLSENDVPYIHETAKERLKNKTKRTDTEIEAILLEFEERYEKEEKK